MAISLTGAQLPISLSQIRCAPLGLPLHPSDHPAPTNFFHPHRYKKIISVRVENLKNYIGAGEKFKIYIGAGRKKITSVRESSLPLSDARKKSGFCSNFLLFPFLGRRLFFDEWSDSGGVRVSAVARHTCISPTCSLGLRGHIQEPQPVYLLLMHAGCSTLMYHDLHVAAHSYMVAAH